MEDKFANHTYNPEIRFRGYTDGWEQCKLNEICDYTSSSLTASSSIENGKYILYDANTEIGSVDSFSMNEDYITVIKDGAGVGRIRKLPKNTAFTGTMGALTSKNKETDFLYYLLERKDLSKQFTGSTIPHIYFKDYGKDAVNIPKDKEQQVIGSYFKQLDNLITLHQRKCDTLKNLKASMLTKMFPKEGESMPEIRFKGFTDSWEQRKLGDVVKEITRNDPESEAPIMMITANNGFIEQSERYAFNNAGESLKKYILLKKGELAYNHGASKLRPYGSCFALTTAENARIPFVYHCFSAENQNAEFMSIELNGAEIENQLRKIVSSGARMDGLLNISFDEYTSVSVLLPGTEEQDRIAAFFRHLDNLITLHQRKYEKLLDVKKAFLEKMIGGDN